MALDSSGRIVDYFSQCAAGGLFERVFPRKNQAGAEKSRMAGHRRRPEMFLSITGDFLKRGLRCVTERVGRRF